MSDSNDKPKILGPTSLGMDIIEVGGVEDTRVRPLRESLRKHLEKGEKQQPPPPPEGSGATDPKQEPYILVPDHPGGDTATVWMGGEEDTRVRPLRGSLRKSAEQARKRYQQQAPPLKESGDPGAP
jgi:hypothetical protein